LKYLDNNYFFEGILNLKLYKMNKLELKTEKELAKAIITAVIFIVLFVIATKGCSMI